MRVYVIEQKTAIGGFSPVFVTYSKRALFREWANDPPIGSPIVTRRWYVLDRPPMKPAKKRATRAGSTR